VLAAASVALRRVDDRLISRGMIGTRDAGHDLRLKGDGSIATTGNSDTTGATPGAALDAPAPMASGDRTRVSVASRIVAQRPSFWVRGADGDLLVVLNRDSRPEQDADEGAAGRQGAAPDATAAPEERLVFEAVLEELPNAEAMYSWGLTREELERVRTQGKYLRVTGAAAAASR
jgi:hypothetical protein